MKAWLRSQPGRRLDVRPLPRLRVIVTWCSGLSLFPDMWTKAVTFEQFHRYWKEMCGYAKFTQPVASLAGSILIPPEVKVHTWKQCAQGAALLSANVTRIDVTGHVLLFQDASEFLL